MRAGCFAELRVINLLNRRFVPFYFNTGGPGLGKDADAADFVKGKVKNRFAHFTAFSTKGEALDETEIYADKDTTFAFLTAILRKHQEYDRYTPQEKKVLADAKARPENAAAQLAAGLLMDELGRYNEAELHFRRALVGKTAAEAYRGLARMARYEKKWASLQKVLLEAENKNKDNRLDLAADIATERAYHLLAEKRFKDVRTLLDRHIKAHPESKRMGEMHFYAGVASFFLQDIDWAYYHWCWVVENIPDDHMLRRCYIAAAHQGMPYPNPELGGFRSKLPGGNIRVIQAAYANALRTYERVKKEY